MRAPMAPIEALAVLREASSTHLTRDGPTGPCAGPTPSSDVPKAEPKQTYNGPASEYMETVKRVIGERPISCASSTTPQPVEVTLR